MRDATAQEQPTNTDAAVPPTSGSEIEIAQVAVYIVPDGACPDGDRGLILAQHRRVQKLHVDGHAALDVGRAAGWCVAAALDGELAARHPRRGEDRHRLANMLCGAWPDDAGGHEGRLLDGEVVGLGEGRGGDDVVAESGGETSALGLVSIVCFQDGEVMRGRGRRAGTYACVV